MAAGLGPRLSCPWFGIPEAASRSRQSLRGGVLLRAEGSAPLHPSVNDVGGSKPPEVLGWQRGTLLVLSTTPSSQDTRDCASSQHPASSATPQGVLRGCTSPEWHFCPQNSLQRKVLGRHSSRGGPVAACARGRALCAPGRIRILTVHPLARRFDSSCSISITRGPRVAKASPLL